MPSNPALIARPPRASGSVRGARRAPPQASQLTLRLKLAAIVLVYIAALLWNFRYIIGEYFDYMGFLFSVKSAWQISSAIAFSLLPIAWLPLTPNRPSVFVYAVLYLMVYVPTCIVPAFTEGADDLGVNRLQVMLAGSFFIAGLAYRAPVWNLVRNRVSTPAFWTMVACLSGGAMLWVAWAFGLQMNLHSFADVYDVRESHSDVVDGQSPLLVYLISWQANVLGPLLIAFAWSRGKIGVGVVALAAQVWLYAVSGYKTFLLAIPFVAFTMWLARRRRPGSTVLVLACALLALVVFCCVIDWWNDGADFSTILVRRLLLTPGRQTYWYYDFFSENPKVMLSHSVLSRFLEYPYEAPPPELIGHQHFGVYTARANGNLWADAFANFGAAGVIGAGALLGVFLWAYDCAARRLDPRIAMAVLAMPVISVCNSALLTCLLSHGMGLALLVAAAYPENRAAIPQPNRTRTRRPASSMRRPGGLRGAA